MPASLLPRPPPLLPPSPPLLIFFFLQTSGNISIVTRIQYYCPFASYIIAIIIIIVFTIIFIIVIVIIIFIIVIVIVIIIIIVIVIIIFIIIIIIIIIIIVFTIIFIIVIVIIIFIIVIVIIIFIIVIIIFIIVIFFFIVILFFFIAINIGSSSRMIVLLLVIRLFLLPALSRHDRHDSKSAAEKRHQVDRVRKQSHHPPQIFSTGSVDATAYMMSLIFSQETFGCAGAVHWQ